MRRLLLVSNSTLHGQGYLDHCAAQIQEFLGAGARRVLFVPYALHDRDAYAAQARARFAALALVPFNVNPHYLDPPTGSTHMGETREVRIRQFHEDNEQPVVGLREGAMLHVDGDRMTLLGTTGARIFRRGRDPEEVVPGADLSELLA